MPTPRCRFSLISRHADAIFHGAAADYAADDTPPLCAVLISLSIFRRFAFRYAAADAAMRLFC